MELNNPIANKHHTATELFIFIPQNSKAIFTIAKIDRLKAGKPLPKYKKMKFNTIKIIKNQT